MKSHAPYASRLAPLLARSAGLYALAIVHTAAWGQPHGGDILLTVTDGRIVTGAVRAGGEVDSDVRIFQSRLGAAAPDYTADPGFDCEPGTFPPGTRNGFVIEKAVRVWNGSDFYTLSPTGFEIAFATLTAFTPPEDAPVLGFTLAVGSNGQWHRHLDYTLLPPAEDGLYLLELSLFSTAAEIAPSAPFWLIFAQNVGQAGSDLAAEWVRSNLLSPACIADFNSDGGVDGGDVEAFFVRWESGESDADVNLDGGVDGGDVEFFFTVWERGGC
jgi:hypothetical protein